MVWSTTSHIRLYTGLTTTDVSDENLTLIIAEAERVVLDYISTKIVEEDVTLLVDDNEFKVKNPPLTDTDFDEVVDKKDITIYVWTDADDDATKSTYSADNISSVNATTGRVVTSTVLDVYDKVAVTYRSSLLDYEIPYNRLDFLTALVVAYIWLMREYLLLPDSYAIGPLRARHSGPWTRIWKEFQNQVNRVRSNMWGDVEFNTPILRREKELYKVVTKPERDI